MKITETSSRLTYRLAEGEFKSLIRNGQIVILIDKTDNKNRSYQIEITGKDLHDMLMSIPGGQLPKLMENEVHPDRAIVEFVQLATRIWKIVEGVK